MAPEEPTLPSAASTDAGAAAVARAAGAGVKSNSVLEALLDSHYTELVEKALLIQMLEGAVGRHNVTIFAPRNLDPEFKRFLLEPRNLKSLQSLLLFHVLPSHHPTVSGEEIELAAGTDGAMRVARPDAGLRAPPCAAVEVPVRRLKRI